MNCADNILNWLWEVFRVLTLFFIKVQNQVGLHTELKCNEAIFRL